MKHITIYLFSLFVSSTVYAQNAPAWTSSDACLETYFGSLIIEFEHDLDEFPLPYTASYYNNTTGDYEEIIITSSPFTISDLSPGEYELEVFISDADIMEFCAEVYVLELNLEYEISQACPDNGKITLLPSNGQEPYFYSWSNGSTDQVNSDLVAGTYYATVTDVNGCKKEISVELNEEPSINLDDMEYTIDHAKCNNNPNLVGKGFISIYNPPSGGTPPFSYTWNNGNTGNYINNLDQGIYTVNISDAAGCAVSMDFEIEEKGLPIIEEVQIENTCNGYSTGAISIFGQYSYDYIWSTGSTDSYIAGLSSGTYSVTITDGCSIERTYEIINQENGEFAVTSVTSENSCIGENEGSISLTFENNVPRVYAYWDDGEYQSTALASLTRSNLSAGEYTVTLEDECGREVVESYTVENNTLDYNVDVEPSCNGKTILSLNIINGQYPPYSYIWSGGETESQITAYSPLDPSNTDGWNVIETYYAITVTDGNGCDYITEDILLEHIEYSIEDIVPSCEGFNDGEFRIVIQNVDTNVTGSVDGVPIWFSNIGGELVYQATNLAPGLYDILLEFDNCSISTTVTIKDSVEREYLSWAPGDDDDDDDFGQCTYELICKDVTISEETITQAAYIDYNSATDNSDNILQAAYVNIPSILGPLNPLTWFSNNLILDISGKCGYNIVCGDKVVEFLELGTTKISGAAYDEVLKLASATGAIRPDSPVLNNIGKIEPCQDIFYCEATFEIMGYEDAIGWRANSITEISDNCYHVDCDGVDETFCLDDILPTYTPDPPPFYDECKPRRYQIITLIENLNSIKAQFGEKIQAEGDLIPLIEQLASIGLVHGCGSILFCEKTFKVLSIDLSEDGCEPIPDHIIEYYESYEWIMPETYCDYAIDNFGRKQFMCACDFPGQSPDPSFCVSFIEEIEPFGLKDNENSDSRSVRKIKSGNQQNGFSFSKFSNKRNSKFSFPQIMSNYPDNKYKIYIDEKLENYNLAVDNQDMNFDLDVISGSYKVNESESYILYRASDNNQHFTLTASEKIEVKGVDNSVEGQLEYFGTYAGNLSTGSHTIKNGSHFMGIWNNRDRGELYSIPNSNEISTKFYCSSKGNFAINTSENILEVFKISDSKLESKRIELDNNEKSMNVEFVTESQLILISESNNDLRIKSISLDQNKKGSFRLLGDYTLINKSVSQNVFYTDVSVSFRGQLLIEGHNLRSGSSTTSFAILRFDNDFNLLGYYFDDQLTCEVNVKETITYENNHIAIGGDFISSELINKIGNSEYYNSGLNISTPFKSLIYDELFTNIVDSRSDKTNNLSEVLLYPNPTISKVSVVAQHKKIQSISVIDTKGTRLISIDDVATPQYNLDVSNLQSGLYIVEVKISETIITKKLVIME